MASSQDTKLEIQRIISGMMDRVLDRVLITDPFVADRHRADKPLYAALVPDEIFKGSHFERRFVTPFGKVWERLAVLVAIQGFGKASQEHRIEGLVKVGRLQRISEVLSRLEHTGAGQRRQKPNWAEELHYILSGDGEDIPVQVVCDVFAENTQTGEKFAFELKAPLPNSDITKVSKEKILKLHAMHPQQVNAAYFALPYNPYVDRANYIWPHPMRWFDMQSDPVVLIGEELWDKLGGVGTYQAFIEAVNDIGSTYKDRIYREFLGIEPPHTEFVLR
jgi:hypothetical protein